MFRKISIGPSGFRLRLRRRRPGVVLFPSVPLRASPLTAGSTGIMRGSYGGAAFRYSPAGRRARRRGAL
jgi:hypothetical protein